MAFVTDKEELKPGLVIFRRGDVEHRNWYARVKMPKADRYKTVSLKTADVNAARAQAWEHESEIRHCLKHDVPVFNRPFSQIGKDYMIEQERRAQGGEITHERVKRLRSVIQGKLNEYVGTTQIHLIGPDRWDNYPCWRRASGEGRMPRAGFTRARTDEEVERSQRQAVAADVARLKSVRDKGDPRKFPKANAKAKTKEQDWIIVSDATIRFEMSIFAAVMSYAASKRYITLDRRFENKPNFRKMRRDEFSLEEYRSLHTKSRAWMARANRESSRWYRTVAYNFMLIMCNTGMRPPEAKNLRWRDITYAKDREGRDLVVMFVSGKGKSRKLVAPQDVGKYLDRIRDISVATGPDDRVFTTSTGKPTTSLYKHLIEDMLENAGLRIGPSGILRSTYCFRHTYATLRLQEGVDVYFLAEQMGTSVKMIEDHYGHVNTIKHADRVLQGMKSWEPVASPVEDAPPPPPASTRPRTPRKTR